jgi:hypothetical protein
MPLAAYTARRGTYVVPTEGQQIPEILGARLVHPAGCLAPACCARAAIRGLYSMATTSGSVGPSPACMCGNGCMSMDGGFQAVRAAGENLQIRTLLKKQIRFFIG